MSTSRRAHQNMLYFGILIHIFIFMHRLIQIFYLLHLHRNCVNFRSMMWRSGILARRTYATKYMSSKRQTIFLTRKDVHRKSHQIPKLLPTKIVDKKLTSHADVDCETADRQNTQHLYPGNTQCTSNRSSRHRRQLTTNDATCRHTK